MSGIQAELQILISVQDMRGTKGVSPIGSLILVNWEEETGKDVGINTILPKGLNTDMKTM